MGATLILIFICRLIRKLLGWYSGKEKSELVAVLFSRSFFGRTVFLLQKLFRARWAHGNKYSELGVKTTFPTNAYFSQTKEIWKDDFILSVPGLSLRCLCDQSPQCTVADCNPSAVGLCLSDERAKSSDSSFWFCKTKKHVLSLNFKKKW